LLVDLIRYDQNLKGTKIGCREGDCGACVVLVGEIKDGQLSYQSLTSCLTPLANVHNKHVVTVEGVNIEGLNPIQQAMKDESATQCGFCTPGFVMSFAGFCLNRKTPTYQQAIASIDGNICRCTGYKSIERAAEKITKLLDGRGGEEPSSFAGRNQILPSYFLNIKDKLEQLLSQSNGQLETENSTGYIGGGTDLYVQKHDELKNTSGNYLLNHPSFKGIRRENNRCIMGASVTVTDLLESPIIQQYFPAIQHYIKLVSSTPIRNIATIAGNFINASPIGDLTIFFLALNTTLVLSNGHDTRELPLRKLYKGYKQLDKTPEEYIERVWFELPEGSARFHFEKVSKRTYLDIASVNSAISITLSDDTIENIYLSAGGVAPIPLFLEKTASFLIGKKIEEDTIERAIEVMQTEISPISDVRGSEAYKRLLLGQLIKAHFIELVQFDPAYS
jgi:xanthine dehydrogenase small subunit